MVYKVGAKIALDGEREFKQALTEINAGIKVNSSELRLLSAQYSANGNSVKALTDRGVALQNQIASQKEKVETLRAALNNAATQYGESDKKTANWKVSLNNAEIQLMSMEGELKDNSEALKTATADMEKYGLKEDGVREQTTSLGGKLSDMINQLGINLPAGADKAIKALDGTKVSAMALIGITAGIITGFAKTTIATAQLADDIMTMSNTTGLATDTLQEFKYASELVDVSVDTTTGAMTRMIRTMGDARDGVKSAEDAYRKLHVRVTDTTGQLKDSETMFYEVIDALGQVRNETERDAIAMDIFGKSARELNPLIKAGSQRLKELGIEAQNMGYVMDEETLESLGALDDAMQRFNKQSDSFKNSIAMVLLPPLTALFDMLNKIDPKILATVAIIGSIAVVAVTVVKGIKSITDIFGGLNPVALKTTAIVVGVTAALIALAAIIAVIIGKGNELDKTMATVGSSVNSMTNTVNQAPNQHRPPHYAIGTDYHPGGLAWVGEEGPELMSLPPGTKVYSRQQSLQMVQQTQGGDTFNLYVKAEEINEVQKLIGTFKELKRQRRAGMVTG